METHPDHQKLSDGSVGFPCRILSKMRPRSPRPRRFGQARSGAEASAVEDCTTVRFAYHLYLSHRKCTRISVVHCFINDELLANRSVLDLVVIRMGSTVCMWRRSTQPSVGRGGEKHRAHKQKAVSSSTHAGRIHITTE